MQKLWLHLTEKTTFCILEEVPRGLPCHDSVLWLVTHVQLLLLVPYSVLLEQKMVNWCVQLCCNGTWMALFTVPQSIFQIHTRTHSHTNERLLIGEFSAQGHLNMWTVAAGIRTADPSFICRPVLSNSRPMTFVVQSVSMHFFHTGFLSWGHWC